VYKINIKYNCLEVVNRHGDFIESFDFNELADATELVNKLNNADEAKEFNYELLIAKSKWITLNGKKVQVPASEFVKTTWHTYAVDKITAENNVWKEYSISGYMVRNLRVWQANCERHN
jgi:hypothetical protein